MKVAASQSVSQLCIEIVERSQILPGPFSIQKHSHLGRRKRRRAAGLFLVQLTRLTK